MILRISTLLEYGRRVLWLNRCWTVDNSLMKQEGRDRQEGLKRRKSSEDLPRDYQSCGISL
jgi:hypothetical protein